MRNMIREGIRRCLRLFLTDGTDCGTDGIKGAYGNGRESRGAENCGVESRGAEGWGQRENLMTAFLCFEAGEDFYDRGNRLCEEILPMPCIYSCLPAIQILFGHGERLTGGAASKLELLLRQGQEGDRKEISKDKKNSFHLISIAAMAGYGVYRQDQETVRYASRALEHFRQSCMGYDAPDEYVSPFYSALQLAALAVLADVLEDTEAGETACALENYIWKGLLDRCHPMLGELAGPYSRGYLSELCGHPQAALGALEAVLGEQGPYSMERMLWEEEYSARIQPHGSLECTRAHALYFAMTDYHCDPDLLFHWRQRGYPCRLVSRTHTDGSYDVSIRNEVEADRAADYPPADTVQQVVLGERYALGWADREYENGMACNSFSLLYEKDGITRSCFTKLSTDDKYIGQWNDFRGIGMRLAASNFPDEGRKTVEETADGWELCYRPRAFCRDARSLKLIFAVTEHFGTVDQIWIGREKITEAMLGVPLPLLPLTIQDGGLRYTIRPLTGEKASGQGCWKILRRNHFLFLEWHKEMEEVSGMEWKATFSLEPEPLFRAG